MHRWTIAVWPWLCACGAKVAHPSTVRALERECLYALTDQLPKEMPREYAAVAFPRRPTARQADEAKFEACPSCQIEIHPDHKDEHQRACAGPPRPKETGDEWEDERAWAREAWPSSRKPTYDAMPSDAERHWDSDERPVTGAAFDCEAEPFGEDWFYFLCREGSYVSGAFRSMGNNRRRRDWMTANRRHA